MARRQSGGSREAARWRGVAIPGLSPTPSVWGTPHTAWSAVREAGGTPPGGHGHAREPRSGRRLFCPRGHRPWGMGRVGALGPLAGGRWPRAGLLACGLPRVRSGHPTAGGSVVGGVGLVGMSGGRRGHVLCHRRSWAHVEAPGPACCPSACPRRGRHALNVSARRPVSLLGVGRCLGPRWGRVSIPVVTGPVRRSSGLQRGCRHGRGTRVRGPRACARAGCGVHPAPNKRLQATSRSVRSAPASGRA
jgi:hypothetical protein